MHSHLGAASDRVQREFSMSSILFTSALWSALSADELRDMQPPVLFWYSRIPSCTAQGSSFFLFQVLKAGWPVFVLAVQRKWKVEKFTQKACLRCMHCLFQARTPLKNKLTYKPQNLTMFWCQWIILIIITLPLLFRLSWHETPLLPLKCPR